MCRKTYLLALLSIYLCKEYYKSIGFYLSMYYYEVFAVICNVFPLFLKLTLFYIKSIKITVKLLIFITLF